MKIEKTNEIAAKGITVLLYGDSGVGKTSTAGTLDNPLLIDIEGGVACLQHKDIDTVRIHSDLSNIKDIFDEISTIEGYGAVMFDSATELEKFMLIELAKRSRNEGMPTLQDYGIVSFRMRDYMRRLRDLRETGMDVIVTALEMPLELEQGDGVIRTRAYPMMGRRLAPEICGLFDIVGHMEVSTKKGHEGERFIRLQPTEQIVAKNRYNEDRYCTADLGALFEKIRTESEGK